MLIGLLEETYAREICRLANARVGAVSKFLDRLEDQGIIVSRYIGKSRRVSINPRFVARRQLADLINQLALAEPELLDEVRALRRRPRRRGKEV